MDKEHSAVVSEHIRGLSIVGHPAIGSIGRKYGWRERVLLPPSELQFHEKGTRNPIFAVTKIRTPSQAQLILALLCFLLADQRPPPGSARTRSISAPAVEIALRALGRLLSTAG